jgi:hypothetical protein
MELRRQPEQPRLHDGGRPIEQRAIRRVLCLHPRVVGGVEDVEPQPQRLPVAAAE